MSRDAERIKRAIDVVGAAAGLALASPILALAACAIKLEDRGPVLFRQMRLGRGAGHFEILKLRTMTVDAERLRSDGVVEAGDPRITRIGNLLRRTAVDELPQLWHVLRGDMSLVGPRPVPPPHLERYDERQRRRLEVRPGLTGWAQIHGRAALPWPERLELDVWYVENRSLALDARILARTAGVLLRRDVAYRGEAGGWR
jgi:lipopolysaccharide/colanic/teichoic acid biosynthesis glycosyltransferase